MTPSEKLQKVIERAIQGGWVKFDDTVEGVFDEAMCRMQKYARIGLLFDRSFAKAFFGETEEPFEANSIEDVEKNWVLTGYAPLWEFHLMKAALSKDPLDYYFNHLNNE